MPAAGRQPLSQGSWTNRVGWTPDGSYRYLFLFYQWFNHFFFESAWQSARCETQIDYFLKHRQKNISEFKKELVGAGSTVAVVDFDSRMSFRIWSGDSVKTREHVTGMNTGSEVFCRV